MKNKIKLTVIFLAIFVFSFGIAISARADSYDIYIDKSYDGDDSDGSSEKPYKKIEDAIEETDSKGKKIYIKTGTYDEKISLPSGVSITGQDRNKVIINGSAGSPAITAKGDNALKNITVTGGHTGILFEGKGNMETCTIKNIKGNAINLAEGSGTVTIKNSNMQGNIKGLYAQKGSSYNISGSNFKDNSGEGIDIREKTEGTISGNYIANNKEGGIEIVVGSSDVSIKNNIIKKNKASGIAAQFYSQAKKTGEIQISGNTISYNGVYGIVCKSPSGGNSSKGYYNKSLELSDNKIENNKRKSISGTCKIMEAVTEEEEKRNQAIESATANEVSEEESMKEEEKAKKEEAEETKRKIEEEARILSEKKITLNNALTQIDTSRQESTNKLSQAVFEIKNRGKIKYFFFGPDYKKIFVAKKEIHEIGQVKDSLSEIITEFESLGDAEGADKTATAIKELENQIANHSSLIADEETRFSIPRLIFKIFRKIAPDSKPSQTPFFLN